MWMNDPNGLVYYQGEYHLFYQYHPSDTLWGPMHWGHAVSRDLVNWQHLPIALYPDENGTIYSGSAVIDWHNTAGFGREAMIAIFTHVNGDCQSQSVAYSTDRGRTWDKYEGNPVIPSAQNLQDFRDPKVFWYDDQKCSHWVMAVSGGPTILFFTSPNLKNWRPSGEFGFGYGENGSVLETPDLFQLPVDGGPETRWVLTAGISSGGPAGGTGTQYFIGGFDGQVFISENPKDTVLWSDFGADYYAAQSWNDEPNGRRLMVGWMSNWQYATDIPTSTWRGTFTVPRELSLVKTLDGIRLVQQPVSELENLRCEHWAWNEGAVTPGSNILSDLCGETLEIDAEFQINSQVESFGFRVRKGEGEHTTIGYRVEDKQLFVDRTHSGQSDFNDDFACPLFTDMTPNDSVIGMHIFVDRSSLEVFGNDGLVVFSERIFPRKESLGLEIFTEGGDIVLNFLDVYELKAATFGVLADTS
jgi:fructan beta-fructosidase